MPGFTHDYAKVCPSGGADALDVERWKKDLGDSRLAERIRQDEALATKVGATGTPAFFVNGRFISGAQPLEVFTSVP